MIWNFVTTSQYWKSFSIVILLVSLFLIQHLLIPIQSLRDSTFKTLHPLSYYTASQIALRRGQQENAADIWGAMASRAEKLNNAHGRDIAIDQQLNLYFGLAIEAKDRNLPNKEEEYLSIFQDLYAKKSDLTNRDFSTGLLYFELGRTSEASERLSKFIDTHPESPLSSQAKEIITGIQKNR